MASSRTLTVYGGSAPREGEAAYEDAKRLGGWVASRGWAVATGGYIGTMEAVSRGAHTQGGVAIGVTCDEIERWRSVEPNRWLSQEIRKPTLNERLHTLVQMGDAWIALPGGLGTLSEVALTWSLVQTEVIPQRPLVLVGSGWQRTVETFFESFDGYVPQKHKELISFAANVEAAWQTVLDQVDLQGSRPVV